MTNDGVTPHPPATPEFAHVVPGGPAHAYPANGAVRVTKLSVGPFDNNVYVIASDGDAVLIDGAAEPERILAHLEGLRVVAILETHNHPDHTAALPALVEALGARVLAHPDDPMPVESEPLAGGETMPIGRAELSVLHTPGHTPGSLCFVLRSPGQEAPRLFTGDTLFPGGPGNTSGEAGRFTRIMRSLEDLFAFPDATGVSPGHGLDTTIGRERPHVETWRARGW
ncbi:MAG TPA: MBL fold metallo-hydrolase [Actinomycetota bacterium]|nr:MBL fold metallo-hydrolase [Actinomycetota bacterium]